MPKKQEKIRLIFADLTSDEDAVDKVNGYRTAVVTLPKGFDTHGYALVGVEWEVE